MKVRDVIHVLERNGFRRIRQNGSHRHFKGIVGGQVHMVMVSGAYGQDVPKGTLGSIKRQSGLPRGLFR